ncbi:Hypothetical predicted protein [Podarcis lilfordi]|uniref:Uncharacterized protein n=1 Tax=Podarcis lilfordi TaxID=74358 RepID=A0AA35P4H3_9SAUR|nr:Hypothetical predicted protein [Podarcis lilfordi]
MTALVLLPSPLLSAASRDLGSPGAPRGRLSRKKDSPSCKVTFTTACSAH